ncbi:AbfB domain-containing protein [Streptomyces sp. NBC_00554]|uniref:AbfB domain-containing protein n=1 Tax=Streptomyces sp. NBC_00554 TaxID=2903661 RepID=UPI00352E58BA|nr:AbfB domain-containing protein [Streptomyces sp. NBC_00554]
MTERAAQPKGTTRRNLLKAATGVGVAALASPLLTASPASAAVVHPGMLHTAADFTRMASKVSAAAQPWQDGWAVLIANSHSLPTYTANPQATIYRGSGTPENYGILYNDIAAAYQNALRWKIQGAGEHGNAARDILNAWSSTLTTLDGSADRFLSSGIYGYEFANAAEIMRGYSGFDLTAFQNLMRNVFYPLSNDFLVNHNGAYITNYWASWDLCNIACVLATGILCDDQAKIDQAITYFQSGAGMGAIANAIPYVYNDQGLAQWQESGRDQGHSMLGIGLMASICEMAWHQGYDLYGYDSNRFMKAIEYVARYNLGEDVPFTDYTWHYGAPGVWEGWQTFTEPSTASRAQVRPIWAQLYNHYAVRRGLFVPNTAAFAKIVEPEGGGGDYGSTSGGYDHLGLTQLTSTEQTRTTLPTGATRSLQSVNYPTYYASYGTDSLGALTQVTSSSSSTVKQQAGYTIVAGLADSAGYSLRASDGRYLRHYAFRVELGTSDGTDAFNEDATFYALAGSTSGSVRLVSHNFPGRCIRHRNYELWVDTYDLVSGTFPADSSFTPVTAWA